VTLKSLKVNGGFMKYLLFVLALVIVISGCAILGKSISDGEHGLSDVFEGTGRGFRGDISVRIYMDGGDITEIVVIDSDEDRFVGGEAIEELIDMVVMYNTTDIDAVSGATESSRGFLQAVENAIMSR